MIALVCLHCNHSNLGDAKFCSECGAGLLRRFCPHCHMANGVGSQFCQDCGARLPPEAEVPEAALLHRPAPAGPMPVLSQAVDDIPPGSAWRHRATAPAGAAAHARPMAEPHPTDEAPPTAVLPDLGAVLQPWPVRAISTVGTRGTVGASDRGSQVALSATPLVPAVGALDDRGSWRGRLHPMRTTIGIGLVVAAGMITWALRGPASTPGEQRSGGFNQRAALPPGARGDGAAAQAENTPTAAAQAAPPPPVVEAKAEADATALIAAPPAATAAMAAASPPALAMPTPDALPAPAAHVVKAPEAPAKAKAGPAHRAAARVPRQQVPLERTTEVARPAPAPAAAPVPRPVAVCTERIQALGLCALKP